MKKTTIVGIVTTFVVFCLGSQQLPAQFIGYTSPQTVTQNVATSVACTGAQQTFAINNLGQTQHYLAVNAIGAQVMQARIEGLRNGVTYKMSDTMLPGGNGDTAGIVAASGFFPQIQVNIQCSPGTATFSAGYTGTWGTPNQDVGDFLLSNISRIVLNGAPANVSINNSFQTPYGNTAGAIFVVYSGATAGGGTISVTCDPLKVGAGSVIMTASLAATTSGQRFIIPSAPCAGVIVSFGNSGAAGTVSIEYDFTKPGFSNINCLQSLSTTVATGTTAKLLALSASANIHICSYSVTVAGPSITTATNLFIGGTGATCGTGTTTRWTLKSGIGGATNDTFQPHQLSAPAGGQLFDVGNNLDLCYTDGGTAVGSVVNISYEIF